MAWLSIECRHRYERGDAAGFELDVQLAIDRGVTALVGPSGSGKSTVLACIAGVLRPNAGRIMLGDRTLLDTAKRVAVPPEKRGIGVVFQDRLLFPHLSVQQNLEFGQRRNRASRVDFVHLVEVLELGNLLARHPHTLSGGERQRVALGRAILRGPELLLLDEPLTALDDELKAKVLDYVQRVIVEYKLPTLLVSHDQADVAALAERTIRMKRGHSQNLD